MSHFTKITAQVKDLEILNRVVKSMGFSLTHDSECRYYYGSDRRDAVINLPGDYDVGITKEGDHYTFDADFYGNYVAQYVGKDCCRLMQKYAAEKARTEAYGLGLSVSENEEDSKLILTMTDPDSGGQIIVECQKDGEAHVRTSGFAGGNCMKFKSLEESLGLATSMQYTAEFYEEEPDTTNVAQYVDTDS